MAGKVRNSNIELLRMLAMFLVLLVHADFFSLGAPSVLDVQTIPVDSFWRIFFEAISIVCVNVFVLISGWFGIKPSYKGLLNFLFQCFFFLTGLYILTLLLGTSDLSLKGLAGCIFATKLNWFIKAYLLLYILSPVLNRFVGTTNQTEFKWILIGFFSFACTYGWIGAASFMHDGYSTIFFIGLYLLARYLRIYTPKWSMLSAKTDILIYFSITLFVTGVSFAVPFFTGRHVPLSFWSYISPTTITGALFLLLAFSKMNIQKNRFINWCGKSCFAVFLMHVSPSTLWHFKDMFVWLHSTLSVCTYWIVTLLLLLLIFFVSIIVDKIRILVWDFCWDKYFSIIEQRVLNLVK